MIGKFLLGMFLATVVFLAPIKAIMILVGLFIFADTFFGIWASKKLKKSILSRKLSRIATKMFIYELAIILFFCIDVFIFDDFAKIFNIEISYFLTKIVGMTFIFLELYSIDEKIRQVKGVGMMHYFKKFIVSAKYFKKEWQDINEK